MRLISVAVALACQLFLTSISAHAEWRIKSFLDRLTEKTVKSARVEAKQEDRGIRASLVIQCLDNRLVGGHIVSLHTSERLTPGRIALYYRLDDGDNVTRFAEVGTDLMSISLQGNITDGLISSNTAKRLRIELFQLDGPKLYYDFNISGMAKALREVPCVAGEFSRKDRN